MGARHTLVGRDAELAAIDAALSSGLPVILHGEAGIGKTVLLDAVLARESGRSYRGGSLESLSWHPYLAMSRALRARLEGEPAAVAATVSAVVGDGLLVLDDLQWTDAQTLAALVQVARDCRVLAALRSGAHDEGAASAAISAMGAAVVPVGPLAGASMLELVARLAPALAGHEAARVTAAAGGNPMLAAELLRAGQVSSGLRQALAARLATVSTEARTAVALLGLLGRAVPSDLIVGSLAELEAAELVAVDETRVALRHALHGEAALALLGETQRTALHRRVARLVADPGEAARHHAAGGERAKAAARALEAAE